MGRTVPLARESPNTPGKSPWYWHWVSLPVQLDTFGAWIGNRVPVPGANRFFVPTAKVAVGSPTFAAEPDSRRFPALANHPN